MVSLTGAWTMWVSSCTSFMYVQQHWYHLPLYQVEWIPSYRNRFSYWFIFSLDMFIYQNAKNCVIIFLCFWDPHVPNPSNVWLASFFFTHRHTGSIFHILSRFVSRLFLSQNKERERMREREKAAREREARYSNGHLFTSLTVSGTTLCTACNKSITAKEALSCPSKSHSYGPSASSWTGNGCHGGHASPREAQKSECPLKPHQSVEAERWILHMIASANSCLFIFLHNSYEFNLVHSIFFPPSSGSTPWNTVSGRGGVAKDKTKSTQAEVKVQSVLCRLSENAQMCRVSCKEIKTLHLCVLYVVIFFQHAMSLSTTAVETLCQTAAKWNRG